MLYCALVRPIFEYDYAFGDPYTIGARIQLECVQCTFLRFSEPLPLLLLIPFMKIKKLRLDSLLKLRRVLLVKF